MHKGILVALTFSAVFLAGCGSSRESREAARYTPGHPTYVEDSRKWAPNPHDGLSLVLPVIPPKSGDRGVTASWDDAKYLNTESNAIDRCHLNDGTILDFVRSDGRKHVLVLVGGTDNDVVENACKGEVIVSLGKFIEYRYNYLSRTKEDTELRQLLNAPKK